jgi:hypothetical protein
MVIDNWDEGLRRLMIQQINEEIKSAVIESERMRLQEHYGAVWDTEELTNDFEVLRFLAPFVVVKSKQTGQEGLLLFQNCPRFYFPLEHNH